MIGINVLGVQSIRAAEVRLGKSIIAARHAVHPTVTAAANQYKKALRRNVPVRTGKTRDSIGFGTFDLGPFTIAEFEIQNTARYVIEGTKPHAIEPKNATVLHFFVDTEEVFTPFVWHPGTQANDFRKAAALEVRSLIHDLLRSTGRAIIHGSEIKDDASDDAGGE